MKKTIVTLLLFFGFYAISLAQTNVTIIGCSHVRTKNFNADTLLNVLNKIKPGVILMELDTTLMDDQGNFKGRAITNTDNEIVAAKTYKQANKNVILRHFDIENRSEYYANHNTFAMENKLGNKMDSLYRNHLLDDSSMKIMSFYYKTNQDLNNMNQSDIKTLNSKSYMQLSEFRERMLYQKWLEVIGRTRSLREYYDFQKEEGEFWKRRNKVMTGNVLKATQGFYGKTIVVLTGAMHKSLLVGYLEGLQAPMHFQLNDLPQ